MYFYIIQEERCSLGSFFHRRCTNVPGTMVGTNCKYLQQNEGVGVVHQSDVHERVVSPGVTPRGIFSVRCSYGFIDTFIIISFLSPLINYFN